MDFAHEGDTALLAEEAPEAWDMLLAAMTSGAWPNGHVLRLELRHGRFAWAWRTVTGKPTILAVSEDDTLWNSHTVEGVLFFGVGVPSAWMTKKRLGVLKGKLLSKKPKLGYEHGWACGIMADERAQLARVIRYDGNKLLEILVDDDAPPMTPEQHPAEKWFSIGQWARGCEVLWSRGRTNAHNYILLCMWLGNAERKLDGKATGFALFHERRKEKKAAEKAAKVAKPAQPSKPHVYDHSLMWNGTAWVKKPGI